MKVGTDAMKPVANTFSIAGRSITAVYDCDAFDDKTGDWKRYPTKSKVPAQKYIQSYDLQAGPLDLVVLDPYGDEFLAKPDLYQKIFGPSLGETVVGVHRKTGRIYFVSFKQAKGKLYSFVWHTFPYTQSMRLPKEFCARLDELKTYKRPYDWRLDEHAMVGFITREWGYESLRQGLVLNLDFHPLNVELANHESADYRLVSRWRRENTDDPIVVTTKKKA